MACSLRNGFSVAGSNQIGLNRNGVMGFCPSRGFLEFTESKPADLPVLRSEFKGVQVVVSDHRALGDCSRSGFSTFSVNAQASVCVSRAMRWWEKTPKPNMVEIKSAPELVDALSNAGDRLVILDFYSPGCGGCKALHPKVCQLAELNPNALFLKVNYEELKTMCYSLNIHVLPFFRFYRGAEGRLCSFSCTNATIKKFKDALAKHGTDQCNVGPAKGLDESELLKLTSNGLISIDLPLRSTGKEIVEDLVLKKSTSVNKEEPIKEENLALVA
ncbi:thioredoxin-like 1-1, chloroplastic [Macadamia integrifolia]|uniref:thioredoxin-like 1-1, chloroplastic n=1 Tax=Macadamia integrifolia TaxID=60698 RepID=UPI001C5005CC|nr:thioredoxin-like 1-1, chloroplastic [Macadamia integrifolia]